MNFLKQFLILCLTASIAPLLNGMATNTTPKAILKADGCIAEVNPLAQLLCATWQAKQRFVTTRPCNSNPDQSFNLEQICSKKLLPIVAHYLDAVCNAYRDHVQNFDNFDGNEDTLAALRHIPEIFNTTVTTIQQQLTQQFLQHPIITAEGFFSNQIQQLFQLTVVFDFLQHSELMAAAEQVLHNVADQLAQAPTADIVNFLEKNAPHIAEPDTHLLHPCINRIITTHLAQKYPICIQTLFCHPNRVNSATFSPDGTKIVSASSDCTAKIWDVASGNLLFTLGGLGGPGTNGHTNWVKTATFSPDGTKVVTASDDYTAKIWDVASGNLLFTLGGPGTNGHTDWVMAAAFSPDGTKVVTASGDYTAKIWNTQNGNLLVTLGGPGTNGHANRVHSATFSPDGTKIVSASSDCTAKIWDVASGNLLFTLGGPDTNGHAGWVNSATFSPNGTKIATASNDYTAKIWDIASGNLLVTLGGPDTNGHANRVNSATFSPDGTKIVSASSDYTAKIWDVASGNLLFTLSGPGTNGHAGWVNSATFSPDGTKVVTAPNDCTAKIWDLDLLRKELDLDEALSVILAARYHSFLPLNEVLLNIRQYLQQRWHVAAPTCATSACSLSDQTTTPPSCSTTASIHTKHPQGDDNNDDCNHQEKKQRNNKRK